MTTPTWRYVISPPAQRDLRRLDRPVRERTFRALDRLCEVPSIGDVRQLRGGGWRLRVGDWRVIFERDHAAHVIRVVRVHHRSRAYRR